MYRLSGHNGLRPTGLRPLFRPEVSTLFAYKLEKNVRYCYNICLGTVELLSIGRQGVKDP